MPGDAPQRQVDGSTIRQRGEAERTRKHALDTNESYLIHPPRCIFHCPMITYRAVTTIHSVTLHVFTDARTGDILGPPCPINHLYPLNFVPSALRLHRLGGTACFFFLGRQLGACHVGATGVPTRSILLAPPLQCSAAPAPPAPRRHHHHHQRTPAAATVASPETRQGQAPDARPAPARVALLPCARTTHYEPRFGDVSGRKW